MRCATEEARTPPPPPRRPRPTCSWQIRNPATNEVIHDRHICMLCCSLSLALFPHSLFSLSLCIHGVHSCSKCLHSHNRLLPSFSPSPPSLSLSSRPGPAPLPREETESGEQRTTDHLSPPLHVALKATYYFFAL